jgi:hypothetical protein
MALCQVRQSYPSLIEPSRQRLHVDLPSLRSILRRRGRQMRRVASDEKCRCRRAHGLGKRHRLLQEDGSVIDPVHFEREYWIVVGEAAMFGRNDPSGAPIPDENVPAIVKLSKPYHVRLIERSADGHDLANMLRQCLGKRRRGAIQTGHYRHSARQQLTGRESIGCGPYGRPCD